MNSPSLDRLASMRAESPLSFLQRKWPKACGPAGALLACSKSAESVSRSSGRALASSRMLFLGSDASQPSAENNSPRLPSPMQLR